MHEDLLNANANPSRNIVLIAGFGPGWVRTVPDPWTLCLSRENKEM